MNVPVRRPTIAVNVKRISRVHVVLPSPLSLAKHAVSRQSMIYEHKLLKYNQLLLTIFLSSKDEAQCVPISFDVANNLLSPLFDGSLQSSTHEKE